MALTIDDGPHPLWTPKVLDVLAANGVHATFSLIGRQARAYPGLVRRIVGAGHGLCNHSMTHPQPFAARSTVAIRQQIVDAQSAISDAAGQAPRLFRAPGGDWTPAVLDLTAELGLASVGWSVDPRDWAQPGIGTIESSLLRARAGDILLTHDGGGNRAQTVAALKAVLPQLRAVPRAVDPQRSRGRAPSIDDHPAVTSETSSAVRSSPVTPGIDVARR